ncbi:NOS3 protein, partial [Fregata magnificens]|nr:NOS3 protein [Fregata magnificens]
QDARLYEDWKWFRCPTLLEVLEEFPSVGLPASLLLTQLPLLQPRYYSISSAPSFIPGEIHLTVAVVTYHSESEWGRGLRRVAGAGGCHGWGAATFRPATHMVTSAPSTPMLHGPRARPGPPGHLPGPQGISRAPGHLLVPKASLGHPSGGPLGSMVLVFGCRSSALDHIYRQEMQEAQEQGALSQVLTAFSREPGTPK